MEINELFEYFLENAGYYNDNKSYKKKQEIKQKMHADITNLKTKRGKLCYDYYFLDKLEGNDLEIIDENKIKEDFESYKELVNKLLKIMPEDYDLKSSLIFNGIDYETFDESSFKNYRDNRVHKAIMNEIKRLNDSGEKSVEELNELMESKFKEFNLDIEPPESEKIITKLLGFLDEIDHIVSEKELRQKYGYYSNFLLGRMYLRIVEKLTIIYDSFEDEEKGLKEKHLILKRYLTKDPYEDMLYKNNELGFISYMLKDIETYKEVLNINKYRRKDGLIEYFLNNLTNIFTQDNNFKYIVGIIKRNFFFFPVLLFKCEAGIIGDKVNFPSKGRFEEAIKMINFYVVYLRNTFNMADPHLIKDSMFSIEDYFNFYFNDDGVTYSFFKILEDFYMDDKDIFLIKDLEDKYNEKYGVINHEEFEEIFKDLCKTKLIKKCNQYNFMFNDEMELMTAFDLDGDSFINDIDEFNEDEEEITDMLKA